MFVLVGEARDGRKRGSASVDIQSVGDLFIPKPGQVVSGPRVELRGVAVDEVSLCGGAHVSIWFYGSEEG